MKMKASSPNSYSLSFVWSESQTGSPLTHEWRATLEMQGIAQGTTGFLLWE